MHYLTLRAENARRDQGMRDEIIDGVNDKGTFIYHCAWSHHKLIYFRDIGDPDTVERLAKLNGRFATVEDAKRERKRGRLKRVPIYFVEMSTGPQN